MHRSRAKGTSKDSPGTVLKYRAQGPTLQRFHEGRDDPELLVRAIIGPLGSGKTQAVINECLMLAHNQPAVNGVRRSRGCVVRNTFPDLYASTIPDWRAITDQLPFGTFTNGSPPTWRAKYRRADGTTVEVEVMFRSFDTPKDVKKARGMQLTWLWINEAAEMEKANVDILLGRVKRYPPRSQAPDAKYAVVMDMNAPAADHWMAELALRTKMRSWRFYIQPAGVIKRGNTWHPNPSAENVHNLAPSYYTDQCEGKKDSWIRKNLANEFVHHSDGRPIHPDFSEVTHVADLEATPGLPLHIGIDFGRTPAALIAQRQVNGQWYFLMELVTVNTSASKFGKLLKSTLNEEFPGFDIHSITGDPSGDTMAQTRDETPFDMLYEEDIEAFPAYTNDPLIRYEALDSLLTTLIEGQPAVLVDREKCPVLIRGLAGEYEFKRIQVAGSERYHDQPDKGPTSHICEAAHYMLLGAGEGGETAFTQHDDADILTHEIDHAAYE